MHSRHENKQRKKRLCIYVDELKKKGIINYHSRIYFLCIHSNCRSTEKVIPDFYYENSIYFMNWSICFIKWPTKHHFPKAFPTM